jgi:glycosyltransferase involved in cell wall biosynthesis
MKILFANGRRGYPLFNGGDGVLMHNYLSEFQKKGNQVLAIGKINNINFSDTPVSISRKLKKLGVKSLTHSSYSVTYILNYKTKLFKENKFIEKLKQQINLFKPDILITQQNDSHLVISIAHSMGIKTVLLIHDNTSHNFLTLNLSNLTTHVIFNSKNTLNHYKHYLNCDYSLIYPGILIQKTSFKVKAKKYITFINPTEDKGLDVFIKIAESCPDLSFLVVKGWRTINPFLKKFKNIKIIPRQYNMEGVYSITKLLLVPSLWEEPFAMVAPEAMQFGIPVIASKNGGLTESVDGRGILINNFMEKEEWIVNIRSLLANENLYNEYKNKSLQCSNKFAFDKSFKKFESLLNRIHRSRRV